MLLSPTAFSFYHSSCLIMFYFLSSHHMVDVKKVAWRASILFMTDLVVTFSKQFRLISLQSFRFVAFSEGTKSLLPPVSSVPILKLSWPRIHTSKWILYRAFLFVFIFFSYRFHSDVTVSFFYLASSIFFSDFLM